MLKNYLIIVRGGGDIATGIIKTLHCSGFKVLVLETKKPTAIRRMVSVSSAVYEKIYKVENIVAQLAECRKDVDIIWNNGRIPILIDENAESIKHFNPDIVIDAILAKKNLGTDKSMAKFIIGVGPGFDAGNDVDVVIETMRGHNLGRIIKKGAAVPNTGIPGLIAGHDKDRVIHAPVTGTIEVKKDITSQVEKNDVIALIKKKDNTTIKVSASISGIVRGMIPNGFHITKGLKIADIDPRNIEINNCYTISDKARCIGGAVLESIMNYLKDEIC